MPLPTLRLPPHGSQRTARGETWFGYSFVPGDLHPLPSASSPGAPDQVRAASSAPLLQHDSSASSRFRHCSHDGTFARADGSVGGSSRDRSAPVSQSMHPPAFLRVTSGASIADSYYRPTPKWPTIAVRYAPRRLPDTVNAVTRKVEVV